MTDDNNNIDFYIAHTPAMQIKAYYTLQICIQNLKKDDSAVIERIIQNFNIAKIISSRAQSVFEIALVRLSETSDYLPGQVNNPSEVIRWTSEK